MQRCSSSPSTSLPRQDARQITPWEMNCGDGPEFSPKGDWVLFGCEPEGGSSNLYWVHPTAQAWSSSPRMPISITGAPASLRSSMMKGGAILWRHAPAYGDEGNSDVFLMHMEISVGISEPHQERNLG